MDNPDALLFFHDAWLIDGTGQRTGPANIFSLPESNPPLSVYSFFSPYGFSMVCHRSLLALSDLWDQSTDSNDRRDRAPHDQWLFFLATVLGTVRFSPERLTDYRQHVGNAVGQPVPRGALPRLQRARQYWRVIQRRGFATWPRLRVTARTSWPRAAIGCPVRGRSGRLWAVRAIWSWRRAWNRAQNCTEIGAQSARVLRLQQLRRSGVYRRASAWDFTRAALMKDAMLGVALRPLLGVRDANSTRGAHQLP